MSLVVDRIAKKVQSLFFKLQCDQMYGAEAQKSSGSKASAGPKAASSNKDKRQVTRPQRDPGRLNAFFVCWR